MIFEEDRAINCPIECSGSFHCPLQRRFSRQTGGNFARNPGLRTVVAAHPTIRDRDNQTRENIGDEVLSRLLLESRPTWPRWIFVESYLPTSQHRRGGSTPRAQRFPVLYKNTGRERYHALKHFQTMAFSGMGNPPLRPLFESFVGAHSAAAKIDRRRSIFLL